MGILNPINISDQAYEVLSEQIIRQKIRPGERLIEEQLAEELGISRTPLRDAITRLAKDGLVDIERRKGASVKSFSIGDVVEVYDIRMAMEGLATRLATPKLACEDLEQLKALFAKKDTRTLIKADTRLHNLIISSCGNKRLVTMLDNLRNLIQVFRVTGYMSRKRSAQATSDHLKILKALKNRDEDAAEQSMRDHIAKTKRDIMKNFGKKRVLDR